MLFLFETKTNLANYKTTSRSVIPVMTDNDSAHGSPERGNIAVGIWNDILQLEGTSIPSVWTVTQLSLTRDELATTLETASRWVWNTLDSVQDPYAADVLEKWHHLFKVAPHGFPELRDMPHWALKILVIDCWNDVSQYRRTQGTGDGTINGLRYVPNGVSAIDIWNDVLHNVGNPPFASVSALQDLDLLHAELVEALNAAGAWIFIYLRTCPHPFAQEVYHKWHLVHNEHAPRAVVEMPDWVLRNLLVDCWKDICKIVQRRARGEIQIRQLSEIFGRR